MRRLKRAFDRIIDALALDYVTRDLSGARRTQVREILESMTRRH